MSWIKASVWMVIFSVSVCLGDRIEFLATAQKSANLSVNPILSQQSVAPVLGDFVLPAINIQPTSDGFSEILVEGLASLGQLGRPSLPATGNLIAVPDGYRPQLTVIEQQTKTISDVWVAPYQSKARCQCDQKSFAFDGAVYESTQPFPLNIIELQSVGALQSLKFARVAIHPIQFHAASKSITVVYRLKFRVDFIQERPGSPATLSRSLFGLAQNIVSNGKALGSSVKNQNRPDKMLLISPQSFKSALKPFIDWKTQRGIEVEWISFEKAGGSNESLRTFIQNYYDSQDIKPTYLLLVGNAETLPPFMEKTTSAGTEQIAASDYPYSLLSGNDAIPDVLYGRLLANDEEDVQNQISRWIDYEKTPEKHAWYSKGTVIASDEQGTDLSDREYVSAIAKNLKKYNYQEIDELFQGEQTATSANINAAVAEGRSWITYMGHGSGLGWASTNDPFDVTSVSHLTNERLPFILDISCANADYISHKTPFAKVWVTQKQGNRNSGAVAYYGGSVNISWDPPAIMAIGISKAHFEKPIYSLGGSVLAGQVYLSEKKGIGEEFIDNLRWYQLLGDPSLELRTSEPMVLEVKQSIKRRSAGRSLALTVTGDNSEPVPGVRATLSSTSLGKVLALAKTNSKGQALIPLKDGEVEDLKITLTGYNIETKIISAKP